MLLDVGKGGLDETESAQIVDFEHFLDLTFSGIEGALHEEGDCSVRDDVVYSAIGLESLID